MHNRQELVGWYTMAVVASVLAAGDIYEGDAVGRHGRERVSGESGGADRGSRYPLRTSTRRWQRTLDRLVYVFVVVELLRFGWALTRGEVTVGPLIFLAVVAATLVFVRLAERKGSAALLLSRSGVALGAQRASWDEIERIRPRASSGGGAVATKPSYSPSRSPSRLHLVKAATRRRAWCHQDTAAPFATSPAHPTPLQVTQHHPGRRLVPPAPTGVKGRCEAPLRSASRWGCAPP